MNRKEFNVILSEVGVYNIRLLEDGKPIDEDNNLIYKDKLHENLYEIIPNDMTTEEMMIALLAKQTIKLDRLHKTVIFLTIIIFIPFLVSVINFIGSLA